MSHSKKGAKTPRKPLTKYDKVRRHILSGKAITGKQALDRFGLYRLSSLIHKMRSEGHEILTIQITENGTTFAKYKIAKPPLAP